MLPFSPGPAWGCSSVGRALEWHSRGRRFDPVQLHHSISYILDDSLFVSYRARPESNGLIAVPLPAPKTRHSFGNHQAEHALGLGEHEALAVGREPEGLGDPIGIEAGEGSAGRRGGLFPHEGLN